MAWVETIPSITSTTITMGVLLTVHVSSTLTSVNYQQLPYNVDKKLILLLDAM